MLTRICALLLGVAIAVGVAATISTDEPAASITLQPGANAVTWSGSEPYDIANFADTPVTQIHRFDPARQKWLSRVVGQTEATLPELHLLPRVQYLLMSDKAHDLTIPSPLADIEPLAELRFPPAPDDPLRFEAYWPNEDSPLEDLVVLRGEGERLSVRAEIAGGEGEVSVWWMIDGQVNHEGLSSEDVELVPGGHDHGRLYAASTSGEVVMVLLPRVVKLPPLELPEMQFGVLAHIGSFAAWRGTDLPYRYPDVLRAALDLMLDAGLTITMADWTFNPAQTDRYQLTHLDLAARELDLRDMDIIAIAQDVPMWASTMDLSSTRESPWGTVTRWSRAPWRDPGDKSHEMMYMASRWPTIRYWMVAHESNLNLFYSTSDVVSLVKEIRAAALGAYYVNPQAVIVAPGLAVPGPTEIIPGELIPYQWFLQSLYDLGFRKYVDVIAIHPFVGWWGSVERTIEAMIDFVDNVRMIMGANDDADGVLWATSHGWSTSDVQEDVQAELLVAAFQALAERDDVSAALSYNFYDGADPNDYEHNFGIIGHGLRDGEFVPKPAYWALREFLTGQPPPDSD